jgi:hypothetical protein
MAPPIVEDWRIAVMQAHERVFDLIRGQPKRSLGYPLCDAGWRDILERLCIRVETALHENDTFRFVRIKQKFGVLRADWDGDISNETRAMVLHAIDLAVARSACTCETCGVEGQLYNNHGWLATRCAEHALGNPAPLEPGSENIHKLRHVAGEPCLFYARYDRETDTLTEVLPNSLRLEE